MGFRCIPSDYEPSVYAAYLTKPFVIFVVKFFSVFCVSLYRARLCLNSDLRL